MRLTYNFGKKMVSRLTSVFALSNLGFAGPFIEMGQSGVKGGCWEWEDREFRSGILTG